MKRVIYLVCILSMFNCDESNLNKNDMKIFDCSFEGNSDDINNFLGKGNFQANNIEVLIFGDLYIFSKKEEPLMMYSMNNNILETYRQKAISGQFKNDRKYYAQMIDSTSNSLKMKIKSGNKTFTKMKNNSLIIKCTR